MDKQEIEHIRSMVTFGLYKVCLANGYDSAMFRKIKEEQNRLFDNYILNRGLNYGQAIGYLEDIEELLKG